MLIIGLCGEKGVGKDTVFRILSAYENVCRISLADPGKWHWEGGLGLGEATKHIQIGRSLWQQSLTEDREAAEVPNLWVDMAKWRILTTHRHLNREKFVITDIRKPFEHYAIYQWAKQFGGWYETWKIENPRVTRDEHSMHSSETEVDRVPYDRKILNFDTIETLSGTVRSFWKVAERIWLERREMCATQYLQ